MLEHVKESPDKFRVDFKFRFCPECKVRDKPDFVPDVKKVSKASEKATRDYLGIFMFTYLNGKVINSWTKTEFGKMDPDLPNLFKPFARADASTIRSKDSLGLGILVAKGLSRKMGGDLTYVRSSTTSPDHGSDFQIRVPLNQREAYNCPGDSKERITTLLLINNHSRHGSISKIL